jgi:hypothetical protein
MVKMIHAVVLSAIVLAMYPSFSMEKEGSQERSLPSELYEAIASGDEKAVRGFIAEGLDLNAARDPWGTPLATAASWNRPAIVAILLEAGARMPKPRALSSATRFFLTPEGQKIIMETLTKNAIGLISQAEKLDEAALTRLKGYLDDYRLWQNQVHPSLGPIVDPQGNTLLHLAISRGYLGVARMLLTAYDGELAKAKNKIGQMAFEVGYGKYADEDPEYNKFLDSLPKYRKEIQEAKTAWQQFKQQAFEAGISGMAQLSASTKKTLSKSGGQT